MFAVRHQEPAESPAGEYPQYLTTVRNLPQYQSGTQTRRISELTEISPAPVVEVHPATVSRAGENCNARAE